MNNTEHDGDWDEERASWLGQRGLPRHWGAEPAGALPRFLASVFQRIRCGGSHIGMAVAFSGLLRCRTLSSA